MTKNEFMSALCAKLSVLPEEDIHNSLSYYSEMIEDCRENGMSEEEAVAAMGTPDAVAAQILEEVPISRLVKEKMRPKRKLAGWEIALLILGAPLWISLCAALFSVVVGILAGLLGIVVGVFAALWGSMAGFAGGSIGGFVSAVWLFVEGHAAQGVFMLGAGIVFVGLTILLYFAALYTTIGFGELIKKLFASCKRLLTKGEK